MTEARLPTQPPTVDEVVTQLTARGIAVPPGPLQLDTYGDSPELSDQLLALIRQGRKRAGTSLQWAIEAAGEPIPEPGNIAIVLDHHQQPVLITRLTAVDVVPYGQVTAEYAAIEGEGDGSLAYWRQAHWAFFTRECRRIGREPSEDMLVVCSVFEVVREVAAVETEMAALPAAGQRG